MIIKVTVPATSANLGPGFDCLGLALGLWNEVTVTAVARPTLTITVTGEDAGCIPTDERNLVVRAAERLFQLVGKRPSGLHLHQHNCIPVGSGLGSSAAAVLGGLLAANALCDQPLTPNELLHLATELEGHPDNVTPALYGGLTLVIPDETSLYLESIRVPPWQVVVVLPQYEFPTAIARAALPPYVSRTDAVFNASHLALLLRALETADFPKLHRAMQDRLHQPYRLPLVPGLVSAFAAAQAAGAVGVALSGAGPSLIAFAPERHTEIATAVTNSFSRAGLSSRAWILPIDTQGSRVEIRQTP